MKKWSLHSNCCKHTVLDYNVGHYHGCIEFAHIPNVCYFYGNKLDRLVYICFISDRKVLWPDRVCNFYLSFPSFSHQKRYEYVSFDLCVFSVHFYNLNRRQNCQSWLIFAWACRLGTFLFMRILKDGSDRRFDKARDSPATLFTFWTLQGIWVFVTLLPTLILNTERRSVPIGYRDYIGWSIWGIGFLFEVIADMQKSMFKANPENEVFWA